MKKYKLKEICLFNNSSVTRNVDTINIVINYLDTSNLIEGVILDTPTMLLSDAPSRAQRKVKHNTILYSSVRPNQKHYGILKNPKDNLIVSTGFITIDVKDEYLSNIDPYYLYTLLIQNNIIEYLQIIAENSTSAYPSILSTDIANLEFTFPSIKEQHNIANILFFLSQKIALNKAINHNLAAMAKQLYDYWFVQFDFPNEDGKPYKSSGGKMVWNKKLKREIPEGWNAKRIDEITIVYNGATPSTTEEDNYGGDIIWITPKDLSSQQQKFIYQGERNISQKGYDSCSTHILPINSILMSSRAPIGLLAITKTELCTNQGFKNFVPKEDYFSTYLYYYLLSHIKQIEQLGTGTTFKEVSREDISAFLILFPLEETLRQWEKIIYSIDNKQLSIQKQMETLTKQRDELLPLLMTGQVTVG